MSSDSPIAIISPWDVVSLKSVTLKIKSGSTPRGGASSSYLKERSEYALVRSQNIFDSHFSKEGLAFFRTLKHQKWRESTFKAEMCFSISLEMASHLPERQSFQTRSCQHV